MTSASHPLVLAAAASCVKAPLLDECDRNKVDQYRNSNAVYKKK